ncbi:HalX domain-containing protein [Halocalculus aciditolerans]|uniref:DNA-binding protein n=1 Tax=Halocalculus aciditolerans TaxID=1383812 RepID=A0A830F8G8_9EURY|nr:HalX domain-containing protein [Halocalculus aciditolerans]GGL64931.1 DNA-binding protein [Halocalculus aciditolerans]
MFPDPSPTPSVLVVEDNALLAENYERWLAPTCAVTTVSTGERALDVVSDRTDVVFLDRRLPGQSGDAVLERIRERDIDVRVVMVTGVEPDFDILDMGFDDYLVKPVDRDDFVGTVERMTARAEFDDATREYYALSARKAALEAVKPDHELAANSEYTRIREQLTELRTDIDAAVDAFEPHDFDAAFHAIRTPGDD